MTSPLNWIRLTKFQCKYFGIPMIRKNNEILIAPEAHERVKALFKYNEINDEYIEWIKYPQKFKSSNNTVTIDKDRDIIYVVGYNGLLQIDLKNEETTHIPMDGSFGFNNDPTSIVIDNKLHIFSRRRHTNFHMVYDETTKKMSSNNMSNNVNITDLTLRRHGMVYVKSQNKLLFFGADQDRYQNRVFSYDIMNDKWILLQIHMDRDHALMGCIITSDDRYAIIFGGGTDSIEIMDIENQLCRKSKIKCPELGAFRAFLVGNYDETDKIINGYLKRCWKLDEFCDFSQLPNELVRLLSCFYDQEYVHIMTIGGGLHWKMLLNDILN